MSGPEVFGPGLDVRATDHPLGFDYGPDCYGPEPELRRLDDIRPSLREPNCDGPDPVYAIAMDVARRVHRAELHARQLLFGIVTYASGRLGSEPVRSQGHVHRVSTHSGWSPPEVYEIWRGKAVILMQERDEDDPGRCFAVTAGPGQVVIVPPGWAHATISADSTCPLTFGAWCDREYGFDYHGVRAHGGLAWFPSLDERGNLRWQHNARYQYRELVEKPPANYAELGFDSRQPIYPQFEQFGFVSDPGSVAELWETFTP